MKIQPLIVGPFEVNCYAIQTPGNESCLVLDPGADPDRLLHYLTDRGLRPAAYLLTHGHIDHLSALPDLYRRYPAPVVLHARDAAWAFGADNQLPPFYPPVTHERYDLQVLEHGEQREDAGLTYTALATPGHSPGGLCFYFERERVLFSGDTLFQNSVGRTDLPGGQPRTLAASLNVLSNLPDDIAVYPGHGPATTIGEEKRSNFFFR